MMANTAVILKQGWSILFNSITMMLFMFQPIFNKNTIHMHFKQNCELYVGQNQCNQERYER